MTRVRFAPSPTGFLHVGGARTAIFNWLFAKNQGGKFLLRIEDTDPQRSKSELSAQILRSMEWLGMISDEPVIYQSDRIERYREIVFKLVETGKAYYAFDTAEELEEKRKAAAVKKGSYNYDRSALKLSRETVEQNLKENNPYAVRFFVPDGITEFDDMVHGKTSFNNSEIDDFILLRSDGSPVYQVAVVVDDHDMGITHVIRGDDHLSNTPKQIMLYNALGWNVPRFAHLPLIYDEQKKKLSKRRNTVSVEEYKEQGYLSEALFNFLTLLGFAPPTSPQPSPKERELFSREELIKLFSFDRVNKSSAVFDSNKLKWINFQYIQNSDKRYIISLIKEYMAKINTSIPGDDYLKKVYDLMRIRVETINDFADKGIYFFKEPERYDKKGTAKHWTKEIKPVFKEYFELLKNQNWEKEHLENDLRIFADSGKAKAGAIIHILRLALTGTTASPGIFELMETLGKETVMRRIERFLEKTKSPL